MKKPVILLAAPYEGFRVSYSMILSQAFTVIVKEDLPSDEDFITKRARLVLIVNQWAPYPEHLIFEFAENMKIPVVILSEQENASLIHYAQRSWYLHVLSNPVSNEQLLTTLQKILSESTCLDESGYKVRSEAAEETFKKAFRSTTFRRKIDKVIDHIHLNFAGIDNFRNVAKQFDLNYDSMIRALEKKTGRTPNDYLLEVRFEKMLQLIQFTQLSPEEIFIETGYRDTGHARMLFRKKFGREIEIIISEYRKN